MKNYSKVVKVLYAILDHAICSCHHDQLIYIFQCTFLSSFLVSLLFLNRNTQGKRIIYFIAKTSLSYTLCTSPTIVTATLQFIQKRYSCEIKKGQGVCFGCLHHSKYIDTHHIRDLNLFLVSVLLRYMGILA